MEDRGPCDWCDDGTGEKQLDGTFMCAECAIDAYAGMDAYLKDGLRDNSAG